MGNVENGGGGVNPGMFLPADRGFTAWTVDPIHVQSTASAANGLVQTSLLKWPGGVLSNLYVMCTTPILTPTAGQNFAGIFAPPFGARVAVTADLSVVLGALGLLTLPMITPVFLPPGQYFAGLVQNSGVSNAALHRLITSTFQNASGLGALAGFRGATSDPGSTSLPASLGVQVNAGLVYWFGAN